MSASGRDPAVDARAADVLPCRVHGREFAEAVHVLAARIQSGVGSEISDVFNYAMTSWGMTRQLPLTYLQRVVELDRDADRGDANYDQCLALVLALMGRFQEAKERIEQARLLIEKIPVPTFSCWRYLMATNQEFRADLDALTQALESGTSRLISFEP